MNEEPKKLAVYKSLAKCRVELQAVQMMKTGNNKFAGYFYFELSDFLPTVTALLHANNLCGVVSFASDLATLKIVSFEDGSEIVFTSPMSEANLKGCHPVQNLGAVQTYLRRYLYMAALEIVEQEIFDSKTMLSKSEVFAEKATKNKVTPTAGALESFSLEEQQFIKEFAEGIQVHFNSGVEINSVVDMLEKRHLEPEEKVAVWSLLDSKCRSAIKKAKAATNSSEVAAKE